MNCANDLKVLNTNVLPKTYDEIEENIIDDICDLFLALLVNQND